MSTARLLARGSFLRIVEMVAAALVGLGMTPFVLHFLGQRTYGLWVTLLTVVGYYGVLDFGLTTAVTRYVAQALGRDDRAGANEIVRTAFVLLAGLGTGVLGLIVLSSFFVGQFVEAPADQKLVRDTILLLGALSAFNFPARIFSGILEGFLRYDATSAASLARLAVTNVILYFMLVAGYGVMAVVSGVIAGTLVQHALNFWLVYRVFPEMRLLPLRFHGESRRLLIGYSVKSFAIKLTDIVRFRLDNLIIAGFLGSYQVAFYSLGMALVGYYRSSMDSLLGVMMPVFSKTDGTGDRAVLRVQFGHAMRISTAFAVTGGLMMLFYGRAFIERWLGPGFGSTYMVMVILVVPFMIALSQMPGMQLLFGLSQHHRIAQVNAVEAVANLGLSLALLAKYGIYGVALGTAISITISKLFIQPRIVCQELGVPLRVYYGDFLTIPALKTALPFAAVALGVHSFIRPDYWNLLLFITIQGVISLAVIFRFLLTKDDRGKVIVQFQRLSSRPQPSPPHS